MLNGVLKLHSELSGVVLGITVLISKLLGGEISHSEKIIDCRLYFKYKS